MSCDLAAIGTVVPKTKTYQREDVIAQVMQLFWQRGFNATSLSEICSVTHLNKKTIYSDFGDKEALFNSALRRYERSRGEIFARYLGREPAGVENIIAFYEALPGLLDVRGCLLSLTLNEAQSVPPSSVEIVEHAHQQLISSIARNLEASAERDGRTRAECQALAEYFLACMLGLTSLARARTSPAAIARSARLALKALA